MLGIFIPAQAYNIEMKNYDEPLYRTVGEDVDGYIEIVHIELGNFKDLVLVVNDEGLLRNLPCNDVASFLYGHYIAGNAVLMREGFNEDGEPDIIGISENEVFDIFLEMLNKTATGEVEDV